MDCTPVIVHLCVFASLITHRVRVDNHQVISFHGLEASRAFHLVACIMRSGEQIAEL